MNFHYNKIKMKISKAKKQFDIKLLNKWKKRFMSKKENVIAQNIITSNQLSNIIISRTVNQSQIVFEKRINPILPTSDQVKSSTCWLHSSLNMIRPQVAKKFNLLDIKFSLSYLILCDKFEQVNYYFDSLIDELHKFSQTKSLEEGRRIVQLINEPIEEGGYFTNARHLINKYGLIPENLFTDNLHSSNTKELEYILNSICQSKSIEILKSTDFAFDKNSVMEEIYCQLLKFLGSPPSTFEWSFRNSNNEFIRFPNLTPKTFYEKCVRDVCDIDKYVSIYNNPIISYNKSYLESPNSYCEKKYLNLKMNKIILLIKKMIDKNIPVIFTCDIKRFHDSKTSLFNDLAHDYGLIYSKKLYSSNKKDMFYWSTLSLTHMMTIIGYSNFGGSLSFEVANSWGEHYGNKGHFVATEEWLNNNLLEIVVRNDCLESKELKLMQTTSLIDEAENYEWLLSYKKINNEMCYEIQ